LYEKTNDATNVQSFHGYIPNACRIMVNSRVYSPLGVITPFITSMHIEGGGDDPTCTQLVPLADPPHRPNWVHDFLYDRFEPTHDFFFTYDDVHYFPQPWGEWDSGVGCNSIFITNGAHGFRRVMIKSTTVVTEIVRITVWFDFAYGTTVPPNYAFQLVINDVSIILITQNTVPTSPQEWTGSTSVSDIVLLLNSGTDVTNSDPGGTAVITRIQIEGTGSDPYSD